jgi:hypothetical protein
MPIAQIMKTNLLWSMLSTGHCADFAAHSEILTHPYRALAQFADRHLNGQMTCTEHIP